MNLFNGFKSRFSPPPPPLSKADGPVPFLISWNITKRCNLRCAHCYLDASELAGADGTSTDEAKGFIDEIASLNPHAMLILTGGEPLLRPDCFSLSRYADAKGLTVVLGTNGTLLDETTVGGLRSNGVKGVGISLDSAAPGFHNSFRGVQNAWEDTVSGIRRLEKHSIDFHLQLTVTRQNRKDIPALIEFAHARGARALNVFFLVCTGRGQDMTDLKPQEYEETLEYLVRAEKEYEGRIMVRARCAPHFLRVADRLNPGSPALKGRTSGCIAGTGYLRISPEGCVTPCPYMPPAKGASNLKQTSLKEIWFNDPAFCSMREPAYKGNCGDCEYNDVCGGCRARALASSGDLMGEDPWCGYEPAGKKPPAPEAPDPVWTREAEERLGRVPVFLRGMVRKGVERYARSKGLREITPELMNDLRQKTGR